MHLTLLLAALAAAACPPPQTPAAGERLANASGNPSGTLIVGNKGEDSVSFVDLATGIEMCRLPTGRAPHEVAISPDGGQAAVVAYGGNSIDIFDLKRRTRQRTISLGGNAGPH